jgi:thiamine-phosphate diphosphorylase
MKRRLRQERLHGLYGIANALDEQDDPTRLAAQMLEGGCRVIQLRCKTWSLSAITAAAREIATRCREYEALFIVNDHPNVALEAQADGVHLGQLDADTVSVRQVLGEELLIGRSTNALEQIEQTLQGADYLAFGPVFATSNLSHPKHTQGLSKLGEARSAVQGIPLVAIGGITPNRLAAVQATGVDAWAVISAISGASDPVAATRSLCS